MDLGTYTEQAKSFKAYSLNDNYTKSVTLTKENRNQVIEFKYTNGLYKVRYVDESGNLLEPETTHTNLVLGTYTEKAKSFKDYKLNDEISKSITLTEDNKSQVIEFKYNKIKGSYIVRYVDESGNLLENETSHKDLDLTKYTEEAKRFEGYILNDENSKSVTLTEDNKDQVIEFKYNIVYGVTVLPQTGDTSKLNITLILLILSLGSLFFVLKKKQA